MNNNVLNYFTVIFEMCFLGEVILKLKLEYHTILIRHFFQKLGTTI